MPAQGTISISDLAVADQLASSKENCCRYWREGWICWNGMGYERVSIEHIERLVLDWIVATEGRENVSLSRIRRVVSHLKIVSYLPDVAPPCLLDGRVAPWTRRTLVLQNGLLDLSNQPVLMASTPNYLGFHPASYGYRPNARCRRWRSFLREIWGGDRRSVGVLQEWFGYCLLPDASQQKILGIYGPPCSGKSTVARVLRELLGRQNVACPSIRSLSGEFGLWALQDKLVAIIPDATLPRPCPAAEERLKLISGEDAVDIHRKGLPPLSGQRLPTRIVILANVPPTFLDPSGALARRMMVLRTQTSYVGKEDIRLTDGLLKELPGILNWSLEGLYRLRDRGRFEVPSMSKGVEAIVASLPNRKEIRRVVVEYV